MSRSILVTLFVLALMLLHAPVNAQSNDGEKERIAKIVEHLMESYGNPLERKGVEYFGVSIDPRSGSVSHLYEDVDGRVRRGKMFKKNFLFNIRKVDPLSIEVFDDSRFWTIRLRARQGEEFSVHSVEWNSATEKNEDDWYSTSIISEFCGAETEARARELADQLRRLVQLYQ